MFCKSVECFIHSSLPLCIANIPDVFRKILNRPDPSHLPAHKGNPAINQDAKPECLEVLETARLRSFRVVALQVHQSHQEQRPNVDVLGDLDQAIDKNH